MGRHQLHGGWRPAERQHALAAAPGYEESLSKVFVSIIDITERKRMEEALAKEQHDMQAILNYLRGQNLLQRP